MPTRNRVKNNLKMICRGLSIFFDTVYFPNLFVVSGQVLSWVKISVSEKLDFRSESLKKFRTIFFVHYMMNGCSKKNRGNYPTKAMIKGIKKP